MIASLAVVAEIANTVVNVLDRIVVRTTVPSAMRHVVKVIVKTGVFVIPVGRHVVVLAMCILIRSAYAPA